MRPDNLPCPACGVSRRRIHDPVCDPCLRLQTETWNEDPVECPEYYPGEAPTPGHWKLWISLGVSLLLSGVLAWGWLDRTGSMAFGR